MKIRQKILASSGSDPDKPYFGAFDKNDLLATDFRASPEFLQD